MKLFKTTTTILFLTAVLIFLTDNTYAGKETEIAFDQLPSKLLAKAQDLMPSAVFSSANTELEDDGTLIYEIQGTLEDGRRVEVDLYEDGTVQEIEVEFTKDLVPGAVMIAIEKKYPGFEPTFIEASHSASKKVLRYEFVGVQNGRKIDLEVSADGRNILQADK